MPTGMKVFVGGLLAIIVIVPITFVLGYRDAAWFVGYLGTLGWMLAIMLWVVLFDSKKRWPSKKALDRYASVITFDGSTERVK